jgi:hypothetical protein
MGDVPYQVFRWVTALGADVSAMVPPGRSLSEQQRADLSAEADKLYLVDPDGIFHFTLRFEDTQAPD